jgi:hypothetical protein
VCVTDGSVELLKLHIFSFIVAILLHSYLGLYTNMFRLLLQMEVLLISLGKNGKTYHV